MDKRRENFNRIASARTNEILRRLKLLGNCANRSNYDYTEDQVGKIMSEIDKRLRQVKAKFTYSSSNEEFKL